MLLNPILFYKKKHFSFFNLRFIQFQFNSFENAIWINRLLLFERQKNFDENEYSKAWIKGWNIQWFCSKKPPEISEISTEAIKTLELWNSSYLEVRSRIEQSGRDARWEFPKNDLFGKTNYMAGICKDLCEVAQVLQEFYNFFGPELTAVTGDSKKIDDVLLRVKNLVKPMKEVVHFFFLFIISIIRRTNICTELEKKRANKPTFEKPHHVFLIDD